MNVHAPYCHVSGFKVGSIAAGIKASGAPDLTLIVSECDAHAAAVFTKNLFAAAPVLHGRKLLRSSSDRIRAVLVNSGCANACTGSEGEEDSRRSAQAVEKELGIREDSVFVLSTGVIGVRLPMEKVVEGIPRLASAVASDGWEEAARGIMTTDTRPKLFCRTAKIGGVETHFTGIAKGAGMIHPDMATMLGIVATDASISSMLLQQALNQAVDASFHCISVDGDTSTNDTVLVLANGRNGAAEISDGDSEAFAHFRDVLTELCRDLAQEIVRDGEGATKFVTIYVEGVRDSREARTVARTIATSPLVKTALFGGDPNWGRILAAAGRAGVDFDPAKVSLRVSTPLSGEPGLDLIENGTPLIYSEAQASALFAEKEVLIHLSLGAGSGKAEVWTIDFSYEYVKINGSYRT